MIRFRTYKNRRIILIFSILIPLLLSLISLNSKINSNLEFKSQNDKSDIDIEKEILKSQDLTYDNIYGGVGNPLNVTHWANRTDSNIAVSFTNNSYDIAEIPLGSGWKGYKLDVNIHKLSDTRNWCNGSFKYGDDNGYLDTGNDTTYISNKFQNWTFGKYDDIGDSDMAGNYLDSNSNNPETDDHDCLELKITGWKSGSSEGYDGQDRCYWTSFIEVPRGRVINSELKFDVRDFHLMPSNDFELRISINAQQVYSFGALSLRELCKDSWRTFSIPQGVWWNSSEIYSNPINNSLIEVNFTLIYNQDASYLYTGVENQDFQQLFIDNIQLIMKTEVKPSQIQLKMNNQDVNDGNWGKGIIEQNSLWTTSIVKANFSTDDIWKLGGYEIDLKTNLNLFARKDTPETNYETNSDSLGARFSVTNYSLVNWEFYAYFSVPNGYEENEMRINFPADFTITWVSDPQDPSTNRLNECNTSAQGLLLIPVSNISTTPDGFWKFESVSPNYCEQLKIYNNATGSWTLNNKFISGEFINISAKITNSLLIINHIQLTKAQLNIRFPNGSIWTSQNQLKTPDDDGYVYFDYFQIPTSPPNYAVGEYEVIITWNNSYSIFGLNETGIIYKTFSVIHKSSLIPDQYFFEDVFEEDLINLKVSFNDMQNFDAIKNAQVYVYNFIGVQQYFSEISPGYYFLEFNTTGGIAGNNYLTIYANSSSYLNNKVNVSIELIQATVITAEEYPNIQIMWNDNFTIHLNYTMKSSGLGITTSPTNNWIGETYYVEVNPGEYHIICNSSAYEVNKFHSLIINADAEGYESQSIIIGIFILKRQANMSVYIDSQEVPEMYQVDKSYNEDISISLRISDIFTNKFLSNEIVTLVCEDYVVNLTFSNDFWYNLSLTCSPSIFSLGLNFLNIRLIKNNYEITIFSFQLVINQIEININPIGFEDSISAEKGERINIQIQLLDPKTNFSIEDATVSYSWEHGIGTLNEISPGLYQTFIKLPKNLKGNFKFNITVTPNNINYKTTQYSFIIIIEKPIGGGGFPNYLLWIIIGVLVSIVSALGILSLRSYIFLPRRRRKESELLAKTQRFKDLRNIQAIVIIHRLSGIPLYSKSYSILEKHNKELFSGFIQAITTIGEEFSEKEAYKDKIAQIKKVSERENIIELNFKYFYCVIADKGDIRAVFILKEKSSSRLKEQISNLMLALNFKLAKEIEDWDGSLDQFEELIPLILNDYFELFYKDAFKLADDTNLIKLKKEKSLTKMEIRVLNVVQSMSKRKLSLSDIIQVVSEENKDLVIEAIETLIEHEFIVPINL